MLLRSAANIPVNNTTASNTKLDKIIHDLSKLREDVMGMLKKKDEEFSLLNE